MQTERVRDATVHTAPLCTGAVEKLTIQPRCGESAYNDRVQEISKSWRGRACGPIEGQLDVELLSSAGLRCGIEEPRNGTKSGRETTRWGQRASGQLRYIGRVSPVIKMWRTEIESEIFVYVGSMAGAVNRLRCYPRNRLPRIPSVFFRPRSLRAATSVRRSLHGRSEFLSFSMREYWVQFLVVEGSLDLFYETI